MQKEYKVYCAGPGCFSPDIEKEAQKQRDLCEEYGLTALIPIDSFVDFNQPKLDIAKDIFNKNIEMINKADFVVVNIENFRGFELDTGTSFEIGMAYALNIPVFGYLHSYPKTYKDKMFGLIHEVDGVWYDSNGYRVEDFNGVCNLMVDLACDGVYKTFEECLKKIKEVYLE